MMSNDQFSASNTAMLTINEPIVIVKAPVTWTRRIGTTSFIIGNLLIFAAFGFAAQSLLASLESVQFISNVFFARYLHKEVITRRLVISTAAIIVGNILVLVFADHSASSLTSSDMVHLYATNTSYHVYLILSCITFFACHFTFLHYNKARTILPQSRTVLPQSNPTTLWRSELIEPLTFAISSTLIGTQAILNAKCMSMFIQTSAQGNNEFEKPAIWVVLIIWLILTIYWLKRLDLGLALFPPMFIIPVLQVFYMFFAIIAGGIFFQEFNSFTPIQSTFFALGVVFILGGVYGLAPTNSSNAVGSKVCEELVEQVTSGFDEARERLQSFKREVSLRFGALQGRRRHPITELLHRELSNELAVGESAKLLPAYRNFRRLSLKLRAERAESLDRVDEEPDIEACEPPPSPADELPELCRHYSSSVVDVHRCLSTEVSIDRTTGESFSWYTSELFVPGGAGGGGDSPGRLRKKSSALSMTNSFVLPGESIGSVASEESSHISTVFEMREITTTASPPDVTVPDCPPSPTSRLSLTLPRLLSMGSFGGGVSSPPSPDARGSFRFMHENSFQVGGHAHILSGRIFLFAIHDFLCICVHSCSAPDPRHRRRSPGRVSQGLGQKTSVRKWVRVRRKVMHRGDVYTMLVWAALLCAVTLLLVEADDQSPAPPQSVLLWIVT